MVRPWRMRVLDRPPSPFPGSPEGEPGFPSPPAHTACDRCVIEPAQHTVASPRDRSPGTVLEQFPSDHLITAVSRIGRVAQARLVPDERLKMLPLATERRLPTGAAQLGLRHRTGVPLP